MMTSDKYNVSKICDDNEYLLISINDNSFKVIFVTCVKGKVQPQFVFLPVVIIFLIVKGAANNVCLYL